MFNVTNRKEVQRRRHLTVQHEEDDCFKHQDEGNDHFTTRSTFHGERFFTEDNNDTEGNNAQRHTRNFLVVQQPGCNRDQCHNANNGQQQVTVVDWFKVRFRTVLFNPALAEGKVNNGDQQTDYAKRKRDAPAVFNRQPRGCNHREERTDVDGHVVHGKCTVQTRVVFLIASREQRRRVGFKQAVTDSNCRHTHIDDTCVVTRPRNQRIANRQHDSAKHNDAFSTQYLVT